MKPTMDVNVIEVRERAAEWVARLASPECEAVERAAFEDWLAVAPAHIEAYLEVERIHVLSAKLGDDPMLRAASRKARREGRQVFASGSGVGRVVGWAVAATLVVAVGVVAWRQMPTPEVPAQAFATRVGEQRRVTLSDGTALLLDTRSSVQVRLGEDSREVSVLDGRVQFVVGRDPRPFRVLAGAGEIRDIGTTFQVSRRGDEVDVGLLEGAVVVSLGDRQAPQGKVQLGVGQQVAYGRGRTLGKVRRLDPDVAHGWTRGELVFKGRRLDDLLAESNRYSEVSLTLADQDLAAIAVSGVFRAGNQEALVSALERGWGLRAERVGEHEIRLHPASHSR